MESCGGAHHWARKLAAMGLQPRLIAGHFVSPYRMEGKRGKNDANDAAAVCEAASRPSMRFVPMKMFPDMGTPRGTAFGAAVFGAGAVGQEATPGST